VRSLTPSDDVVDVRTQERRAELQRWQLFAAVMFLTVVAGYVAMGTAPAGFSVALLGLIVACTAAFIRPAVGVHIIVFFSLLGDDVVTTWYPFTKNMSSQESMFFVADAFSFTPLEMVLVATCVSLILRAIAADDWRLTRGVLMRPMLVLLAFVLFGFVKGYLTGHDRNIAVFEMRPLLYLPVLYVLITNVFTEQRQYRITVVLAVIAMGIQSVFALGYWRGLSPNVRGDLEDLGEHTSAVTQAFVFLLIICLIAFVGTRWKKWAMVPLLVPMVIAFVLAQRRAGMVSLFIGIIVMFAVLYVRNRRRFWHIAPAFAFLALVVVIGTWGASGGLGLPANAVKTVFFPDQLESADESSNLYRQIEAYNIWFTIRASPLTGFGFGQPFIVVQQMPDISQFEYWQYLPHNSVLWVWIKLGFFGFVTMLYLFGRAIQRGARTAREITRPDDLAMVVAAFGFLIMFLVFAYVDIGWSIRPAVMLAVCFALSADFAGLAPGTDRHPAVPRRRPRLLATRTS
jgi:O-antigen ligase